MLRTLLVFTLTIFLSYNVASQPGFTSVEPLDAITISSASTGEKPQSKVWTYAGKHWAVLPNSSGTHLWQLDGKNWRNVYRLSAKTDSKADCKVVDGVAHILLQQGGTAQLVSLAYDHESGSYKAWQSSPSAVTIPLDDDTETATLDIDGTGRMWIAFNGDDDDDEEGYDGKETDNIFVRWSDHPYTTWSQRHALATDVNKDDLCAIIAMPGKIGVFWSDQNTKRFGFRTHIDGEAPTSWTANEVPASQSALNIGIGMADDHVNLAIASNGTLYCAVKTGYDNSSYPEIALLVRRPSGSWDNLYDVSRAGTRGIVILDEFNAVVRVVYTEQDGGGNIYYKESSTSQISFGIQRTLIAGSYNNVTSTKHNFNGEVVILASNSSQAVGVLARTPAATLPVELMSFTVLKKKHDAVLQWATASEENNAYFVIEASADGANFTTIGSVPGNGTTYAKSSYSFTDKYISRRHTDQVYYRLRQVDNTGDETLSPVRAVNPSAMEEELQVQAFPNPFKNQLQVQLVAPVAEKASLILYNVHGDLLYAQNTKLSVGDNLIKLSDVTLAKGLYFLTVKTETQQQVLKVFRE
ncbi:T9SS type A sorting domain-containing protein [uncultured Pontibacter sp.]|uniref:T9SS type A sorting domain-containing protein n=1 Tax=uncultured Pontibacter sp. TaxID=453356 RepID=UPI00262FEFD2|nr:T9SS type A sorting domain-containing protein [uncultured Pontibacter sp.]